MILLSMAAWAFETPVRCPDENHLDELTAVVGPEDDLQQLLVGTEPIKLGLREGQYPLSLDLTGLRQVFLCGIEPGVVLVGEGQPILHGDLPDLVLGQLVMAPVNTRAIDGGMLGHRLDIHGVDFTPSGIGGAVRVQGPGVVVIGESQFIGGTAVNGAHLELIGPMVGWVWGGRFVQGNALSGGGAISVGSEAWLAVLDAEFVDNRARTGGAIGAAGTLGVFGSRFDGNEAGCLGACVGQDGYGGAIAAAGMLVVDAPLANEAFGLDDVDTPIPRDSMFEANRADEGGGGIFVTNHPGVQLRNATFCRNAARRGGGMFVAPGDTAIEHAHLRFIENQADYGGGAFGPADFENVNFLGNHASIRGAALDCPSETPCAVRQSLLAYNEPVAVHVLPREPSAGDPPAEALPVEFGLNLYWRNADQPLPPPGPIDPADLASVNFFEDPVLRGWAPGQDCATHADFHGILSRLTSGAKYKKSSPPRAPCNAGECTGFPPSIGAYGVVGALNQARTGFAHVAWVDGDQDGWPALLDCDDSDANNDPRTSLDDDTMGVDQNCDGTPDLDQDQDGYLFGPGLPDGDCDDENPEVHPGAEDNDPGRDLDCDGFIEDTVPVYRQRGINVACRNRNSRNEDTDSADEAAMGGALLLAMVAAARRRRR